MNSTDIIKFAKIIGKSKKIRRTGWVREDIESPESIAEHSFMLVVLAMVLAPILKVNQEKLVKMAIIHDLGELITGDIVAERGESVDSDIKAKKEKWEEKAVSGFLNPFGEEYQKIFHEMIQRETEEAKIFWQLDKLEMAFQAHLYQVEQKKDLKEFFDNAEVHITNSLLRDVLKNLRNLKSED